MLAEYYKAKARTFEALAIVTDEDDMDNDSVSCVVLHEAMIEEGEIAWQLWTKYRVYNERLAMVGESLNKARLVCMTVDLGLWRDRCNQFTAQRDDSQYNKVGLS